jgi:glutamate--cysteine ligase
LAISTAGLAARARESGVDEVGYLDVLQAHVETGRVQADNLLEQYEGAWGCNLDNIYSACKL